MHTLDDLTPRGTKTIPSPRPALILSLVLALALRRTEEIMHIEKLAPTLMQTDSPKPLIGHIIAIGEADTRAGKARIMVVTTREKVVG